MPAEKNFFPAIFPYSDAVRLIDNFIGSKGYYSFRIEKVKLVYFPFWFFNFSAFVHENTKSKEVSAGSKGFDELLNDFSEKFPELARNTEFVEFSGEPEADYLIELKKSEYSKEEVKEVIAVKLASLLGVKKENVIISSLKLIYLPKWFVAARVDGKEFVFEVSLIKKEILNSGILPPRFKPVTEQTKDALKEFLEPKTWLSVPRDMAKDFLNWINSSNTSKKAKTRIKSSRTVQYYIVIAILIILLLYFLWQFLT